jgi:hypothetical protein
MLHDIPLDEYTIVQCDSLYSRNSGTEFQNTLFYELLVENWDDRVFYPTVEAALEAFSNNGDSNLDEPYSQ